MKNCLAFFALAFLLLLQQSGLSQQLAFNQVTPPLGRAFGLVGGIAQDKDGYMWFATAAGLYRYDGYKFKLYTNDPSNPNSLSNNRLETVYADRKGIIWIATFQNGLDRLDPQTGVFTHFGGLSKKPSNLINDTVRAILEDHDGIIWIGTHKGLDRFDPKTEKIHHYQYTSNDPSSLSSNIVRALYEDKAGILWVGTGSPFSNDGGGSNADDGGLNRFDRKTGRFTRYKHDPKNPNTLINNKVRAIFEDSKGVFWVGTAGDGLHTMDRAKGTFQRYTYDPLHPDKLSRPPLNRNSSYDHISFITEDASGSLWIGTASNGISKYDRKTNKILHFGSKDSLSGFTDNSGWSVCNSKDGILWIGTFNGNLFRIDPFHKKIPYKYTGSLVSAFNEKSSTELWIGTGRGLILQNTKTDIFKKFVHDANNPKSLSNNIVTSVYKDRNGTLWVGTGNGLNRLNADGNTFTRFRNNLNDSSSITAGGITAITEGSDNSLWIGTQNGLDLMNIKKSSFTHFRNNPQDTNSLSRDEIRSLQTDQSGNLWIGYYFNGSLDYLDHATRKFRHFLKGIYVFNIYKGANGTFWIGTNNGLYKSSNTPDGITKFVDPASGIEINFIRGIQEDNQQNLWVSTLFGIFKINLKNKQTTIFSANHGVNVSGLVTNAIFKGTKGEIYIGDINGYYVFSPDQIYNNPASPSPHVIVTDFRIGDESVKSRPTGPLNEPIEVAKEISLNYNQNTFSFDFAGISYSSPEDTRHLYMLENYEPIWHKAGAEKSAYYYNVPPGKYTFRVKAANSNGVWTEKAIKITITPPWWRTWWAYGMYALLFIALAFSLHRYQKERLIKAERERTRAKELAQAKEIEKAYHELKVTQTQLIQSEKMASLGELTAGIAHEIQNPLNFVNNFSEVNRELLVEMKEEIDKGNMDEVKSIANDVIKNEEKINHHGKRADAIVKGMLQHSRSSSGEKEPTDINALADEYLRLAYHGLRARDKSFNAIMLTDFDDSIGTINIIPQDIGRVILNLINNAFYVVNEKKMQQPNGYEPTVSVTTKKKGDTVLISVKDNGKGIPKKVLDKIFQPFFTTKPTGQGTGLGLSLSYDIIKAHGGELKVQIKETYPDNPVGRDEGAEFVIILYTS